VAVHSPSFFSPEASDCSFFSPFFSFLPVESVRNSSGHFLPPPNPFGTIVVPSPPLFTSHSSPPAVIHRIWKWVKCGMHAFPFSLFFPSGVFKSTSFSFFCRMPEKRGEVGQPCPFLTRAIDHVPSLSFLLFSHVLSGRVRGEHYSRTQFFFLSLGIMY